MTITLFCGEILIGQHMSICVEPAKEAGWLLTRQKFKEEILQEFRDCTPSWA